jgi:PsbP-like protein
MKKLAFLGFLPVMFLLTALQSANWQEMEKWTTHSVRKYSIQTPSSWDFEDMKGESTVEFFAKSPLMPKAKIQPNINFIVQDNSTHKLNMKEFVELSQSQLESLINGCKILVNEPITVRGRKGHKIVYKGKMGRLKVTFQQYYYLEGKNAYVLTFVASTKDFASFIPTVDKIMNSLEINS